MAMINGSPNEIAIVVNNKVEGRDDGNGYFGVLREWAAMFRHDGLLKENENPQF